MWMAVSHITDVESIILYLYFQINKFVKGFHPLLWSRNQCVCLTKKKKNKINCFEQSHLVFLRLQRWGASKAAVGFGVSLSRTFILLPHSVNVGHVVSSQKRGWGGLFLVPSRNQFCRVTRTIGWKSRPGTKSCAVEDAQNLGADPWSWWS